MVAFLGLEDDRGDGDGDGVRTRNAGLAAVHAMFGFAAAAPPDSGGHVAYGEPRGRLAVGRIGPTYPAHEPEPEPEPEPVSLPVHRLPRTRAPGDAGADERRDAARKGAAGRLASPRLDAWRRVVSSRVRTTLAVLTIVAFMTGGSAGLSHASGHVSGDGGHESKTTRVFTLDPSAPGNNPEGVAWDHRSASFFVGTVGTGTIYRGTLRPFITPDAAAPADSAVGMKVFRGNLYVAGGPTGSIYVYDVATGARLAMFETGTGGFLNDLVVTRKGDVYVTDSFRATLWHVTPEMVAARAGTPGAIAVTPEIEIKPGQGVFNLNGILARHGGSELIVVNSATGKLYRIDIDPDDTADRRITQIEAPLLLGGDGMIRDRGRLVVVIGNPASLSFLKLKQHDSRARLDRVRTDPTLRRPSTVARAKNRYLVVNADFAGNTQPYTVSGLSRSGRHGGHG